MNIHLFCLKLSYTEEIEVYMGVGKSESAFWNCKSDHKIVKVKVMIPICLDNQKKKNLFSKPKLIGSLIYKITLKKLQDINGLI